MPRKGTRLTAEQIGLLRAWIDQGAPWDKDVTFARPPAENLAPRSPKFSVSRRNSNSDVDGSALALTALPLIVVFIVRLITLPPCRLRLSSSVRDHGG